MKESHNMNTMIKRSVTTLFILSSAALTGCSSLGSSEYGCSGMPDGVRCMSTKQVYEATETTDQLAATNEYGESDEGVEGGLAVNANAAITNAKAPSVIPATHFPRPVRMPAQVMRIWFAPWEDMNGDLYAVGLAYTEIEKRKWTFGNELVRGQQSFNPLTPTSSKK